MNTTLMRVIGMMGKGVVARHTLSSFNAYVIGLGYTSKTGTENSLISVNAQISGLSESGVMYGTSYSSYYTEDSKFSRIVQHGVGSYAAFAGLVSNSATVAAVLVASGSLPSFMTLTRNGYVSNSYGAYSGARCTSILYWDYTTDTAMQVNPFAGTAATELFP